MTYKKGDIVVILREAPRDMDKPITGVVVAPNPDYLLVRIAGKRTITKSPDNIRLATPVEALKWRLSQ